MPSTTLTKSRSNPNLPPPSPIGTRRQVRARAAQAAAAKSGGGVGGSGAGAATATAKGRASTGSTASTSSKKNGKKASSSSLKTAVAPVVRDANGDDSSSDLEIIAVPAPRKIASPTPSPTPTPKATPTPTPPPRRSVSFSQLSTASTATATATATANRNATASGSGLPRANSGSSTSPNRPPPKIKADPSGRPPPKKKASWQDEEDKLDNMFVSKPWKSKPSGTAKRVPKPYQKPEPKKAIELSSASSSPSSSSSPPPGPEQGAAKAAKLDLPDWTKGRSKSRTGSSSVPPGPPPRERKRGKAVVHDSEEDSEEEEEEEEEEERRPSKGKERRRDDDSDSRRRRKKSKSLTPPAPPQAYQLQSALSDLRANLGPSKLSSFSGNDEILDVDDRTTDEEDDDDDIQIMDNGAETSFEKLKKAEREKDDRTCTIRVTWVNRVDPIMGLEKNVGEFEFVQKIHENFSNVFATISRSKFIRQDDLTLTYNDRTVYSFGNPNALKIYGGIEELFAYHKAVHDKAVEFRKLAAQRAAAQAEEEEPAAYGGGSGNAVAGPSGIRDPSREPSVVRAQSVATNDGGEGGGGGPAAQGEKFKISIRGSATQVLAIAVKKSITLQKLLDSYCKTFDIPLENARNGKAWLEFDGEKLDLSSKLEDCDDIEEEETLDVRVKK